MGQIYTNLIAMVHPKCRSSYHVVWVRVHWSHNFAAHTTVLPTKTILITQWLHSIAGKTAGKIVWPMKRPHFISTRLPEQRTTPGRGSLINSQVPENPVRSAIM